MLDLAQRRSSNVSDSYDKCSHSSDKFQDHYKSKTVYTYSRFLGSGSFGEVHEVLTQGTKKAYARKTIRLGHHGSSPEALEREIRKECEIMERLTHEHIVRLHVPEIEHDVFHIYMSPVADQTLGKYLGDCAREGFKHSQLENILPWYGCLLHALAYSHSKEVVHQDIKLSNILIKEGNDGLSVILADFGMVKDLLESGGVSATDNANLVGTPVYRAPEVRPGQLRGRAADIFSLGCVFSEMLTVYCRRTIQAYQEFRRVPHAEVPHAFRANLHQVKYWIGDLAARQDDDATPIIGPLIHKMIREDSETRPKAQDAVIKLRETSEGRKLFCKYCSQ